MASGHEVSTVSGNKKQEHDIKEITDELQKEAEETITTINEKPSDISPSARGARDGHRLKSKHRTWNLKVEPYEMQKKQIWPESGRYIIAQFDEDSVVVYQAFKPAIADFAVKNQRFGGEHFSFSRMSWIKTNFMWMMYRCGWATKKDQERVLAVWLSKKGFEEILAHAHTIELQKSKKLRSDQILVRLQWDPDHSPIGGKLSRRAIQLGLNGEMLRKYSEEFILHIKDITDFVHEQHQVLQKEGNANLVSPKERIYHPEKEETAYKIQLDFEPQQTVVSFGV